jgi:phage-related protein (TIGR01555 family)
MFKRIKAFFEKPTPVPQQPDYTMLMHMLNELDPPAPVRDHYIMPALPDGVVPPKAKIAQDSYCQGMNAYTGVDPAFFTGFIGYPRLAQLSQSSEYRSVVETTAEEMTREWGEVKGDEENLVKKIEDELKRLNVRDLMRKHIENDMTFGRSQIFIRIKGQENNVDLPLLLTPAGVPVGSLDGLKVIEPIWTTPTMYNANDPTGDDFYVPEKWSVLGKETHADRLLTLIMRPVPDMMKPAYNFSGISMCQLMIPYVQRFHRTVDSVSDLVHTYSMTGLSTNMEGVLSGNAGGVASMITRVKLFAKMRDNQNIMMVNKDTEEFFQLNTPLTTLDALQDQAHKMLCTPSKTPQVKLLGLVEGGLSSSQDGEIRVYYDHISALQEAHLLPQMEVILKLIMLNLSGKIDESIVFKFKSLYQLSSKEQAEVNEIKARTAQTLIDGGIIDGEEARTTLQQDEDNDYQHIDVNKVIDDYEDTQVEE